MKYITELFGALKRRVVYIWKSLFKKEEPKKEEPKPPLSASFAVSASYATTSSWANYSTTASYISGFPAIQPMAQPSGKVFYADFKYKPDRSNTIAVHMPS